LTTEIGWLHKEELLKVLKQW